MISTPAWGSNSHPEDQESCVLPTEPVGPLKSHISHTACYFMSLGIYISCLLPAHLANDCKQPDFKSCGILPDCSQLVSGSQPLLSFTDAMNPLPEKQTVWTYNILHKLQGIQISLKAVAPRLKIPVLDQCPSFVLFFYTYFTIYLINIRIWLSFLRGSIVTYLSLQRQ